MRVADCFLFNDELDLLEIRLTELDPVVDVFVIVESNRTFQGGEKPYHFAENLERFAPWQEKIRWRAISGWSPQLTDAWARERFSREAIVPCLDDFSDQDRVLVSDVDEIPRADEVAKHLHLDGITGMAMPLYYYWLNCRCDKGAAEAYTHLGTIRDLRFYGAEAFRRMGTTSQKSSGHLARTVYNSGWHFSCMGGPDALARKMQSFSHTEYARLPWTDPAYLRYCMEMPLDFIGGRDYNFRFVEIDATYPLAILAEREKYAHHIWPKGAG